MEKADPRHMFNYVLPLHFVNLALTFPLVPVRPPLKGSHLKISSDFTLMDVPPYKPGSLGASSVLRNAAFQFMITVTGTPVTFFSLLPTYTP